MPVSVDSRYVVDTFYFQPVPSANRYSWSLSSLSPNDIIVYSNQDSTKIAIKYKITDNFSRVLRVYSINGCGDTRSNPATLPLNRNWPTIARYVGQISASTTCSSRIYKYRLSLPVAYANTILWTVPNRGVIIDGQGTRVITVKYDSIPSSINGLVSAKGLNACGSGRGSSLVVNIAPCSRLMNGNNSTVNDDSIPVTLNQIQEIKIFPLPTTTSFNVQVKTSLIELIQFAVFDLQGRKLLAGSIKPGEIKELGRELMPGYYILEIRQAGIRTTRKLLKL